MKQSDDPAARPDRDLPDRDLPAPDLMAPDLMAPDLMAQVLEEYDRRRATLRMAELQLAQLDDLVIDGTIDYPLDLVRQVLACRRDVAAFTEMLTDLLRVGDSHAVGGGPQLAQSEAFRGLEQTPPAEDRRHELRRRVGRLTARPTAKALAAAWRDLAPPFTRTLHAVCMEHSRDDAVCPARDLMAQLLAELDRRRATLRAAELQLAQLDDLVIDGTIDYPVELVRQVQTCKREVAAITNVLADMLGFGDGHAIGA